MSIVESWPRLSGQLEGPRSPDRCQCCAARWVDLERWREHDDDDRPTATVVVLCRPCGKRLIDPHPRLYAKLDEREPHPGTMELCLLCRNRVGVTCPLALCHGGPAPGVAIYPAPSVFFVKASKSSLSGPHVGYASMPKSCSRREVLALVGADDGDTNP